MAETDKSPELLSEWEDFAASTIRKAKSSAREGKSNDAKNMALAAAIAVDKVKALTDRPSKRADLAHVRPDLSKLALSLARLAERYPVSESPIPGHGTGTDLTASRQQTSA